VIAGAAGTIIGGFVGGIILCVFQDGFTCRASTPSLLIS
jgi:hypothetical protein